MLYSSAFRRLAGATQVAPTSERFVFHNRLTHSLEVAQIGRRVAEHLLRQHAGQLDGERFLSPDVVEAAALAHDLGHPPFGHLGERTLDNVVKKATKGKSGFEGNAQSFRIVTRLAARAPDVPGLDLTRATCLALMKYPWGMGENAQYPKKYGVYAEDRVAFEWCRKHGTDGRTLEAQIMDFADDVAYSVHDVYDFTRSGHIPLESLGQETTFRPFRDYVLRYFQSEPQYAGITEESVERVRTSLLPHYPVLAPFDGSLTHRQHLRSYCSVLIRRFAFSSIAVQFDSREPRLFVPDDLRAEIEVMKQLVWYYVIESPALVSQQLGQGRVVETLFGTFLEEARKYVAKDRTHVLPAWAKELLHDQQPEARVACDVVSSLTELQAAALFRRVTGLDVGLFSDPVFA